MLVKSLLSGLLKTNHHNLLLLTEMMVAVLMLLPGTSEVEIGSMSF